MKFNVLLLSLLFFVSFSCSDDDAEACTPGTFEENVIGTWTYSIFGGDGVIAINADGTYETIEGEEIISNGDSITSREWRIEMERLVFQADDTSLMLTWLDDFGCDSFTLDGEMFIPNITFSRN